MITLILGVWLSINPTLRIEDGHIEWDREPNGKHSVYFYSGPQPAPEISQ